MDKKGKEIIQAKGLFIEVYTSDFRSDYISLTDIARYKNSHEPKDVVKNWLELEIPLSF